MSLHDIGWSENQGGAHGEFGTAMGGRGQRGGGGGRASERRSVQLKKGETGAGWEEQRRGNQEKKN